MPVFEFPIEDNDYLKVLRLIPEQAHREIVSSACDDRNRAAKQLIDNPKIASRIAALQTTLAKAMNSRRYQARTFWRAITIFGRQLLGKAARARNAMLLTAGKKYAEIGTVPNWIIEAHNRRQRG